MTKKASPSVNPTVFYEQLFKNNVRMFDGRNQGRSLSEPLPEPNPFCLGCFARFGIEITKYPITFSGNGNLPPLDTKYVEMENENYGLLTRAEREIEEMNERDLKEDPLIENPDTEENHW